MVGSVISVKASRDGKTVKLEVKVGSEKRILTVSEGTYREIGCPLSGDLIDADTLLAIEAESRRRGAMEKASRVLAYADNNKKSLYRKLLQAGYSKEESLCAVEECVARGFIDEERQLLRLIEKLANADGQGPYKILARLAAKGYAPRDISAAMTQLTNTGAVDFSRNARLLLERLQPEGAAEKQKILYKYGYKK